MYKLDRLSRRQRDVLHLLEEVFEPAGVAFRSVTEPFDTTTPFGRSMLGMLSVFAQLERETIVERSRMGMKQRIKSGDWHGGTRATFGYDYRAGESRALLVNPAQAETVRLMFCLYTEDLMGYEAIAGELTQRGCPTPRGAGRWQPSTVARILRNPIYTGRMLHGFHGKRDLYPGNHEALIADDLFARAQRIMRERREQQAAPKRRSLLSGLLRCAECGGKMRSKTQWVNWPRLPKKMHRNYVCYNYLGEPAHLVTRRCSAGYRHGPDVERQVIERLSRYAFEPDLIDQTVREVLAAGRDAAEHEAAREQQLRRELDGIEGRLGRWYAAFEDGSLPAAEFGQRVSALHRRREELEAELARLRGAGEARQEAEGRAEDLRRQLADLPDLLPTLTQDELWSVLHNLVSEIRVDAGGRVRDVQFAV